MTSGDSKENTYSSHKAMKCFDNLSTTHTKISIISLYPWKDFMIGITIGLYQKL